MAWNREHAGVAAAPAVGETVWWVTLVDATLVRYHPRDYERALANKEVRRRKTEGALEGLRYVRNQLGKSVEPDEFVCPAVGDDGAGGWAWRPLPEPRLDGLAQRARQWELSRYSAYQGAAGRARHRQDLRPMHRIPRPGCGPRRAQLLDPPARDGSVGGVAPGTGRSDGLAAATAPAVWCGTGG
jgi:hypothetical protein